MSEPNPFTIKVIAAIRAIPRGRVATYQQIAGLAGKPHASRAVSWILNSSTKKYKLPWQRVISKQERIAFKPGTYHFQMQRRLLMKEGVAVDAKSGAIDMKRFQYRKKPRAPKRKPNQPHMFSDD